MLSSLGISLDVLTWALFGLKVNEGKGKKTRKKNVFLLFDLIENLKEKKLKGK